MSKFKLFLIGAVLGATYAKQESINIYNWEGYISDAIIQEFESRTGIKVNYYSFDSEEVGSIKVATTGNSYDVLFMSSNPFFQKYVENNLLRRLDLKRIYNLKNINSNILHKINKDVEYHTEFGVAYAVGLTSIVYDKMKVGYTLDSWSWIFDPEKVYKIHKCGLSLLDSVEEMYPLISVYKHLSEKENMYADRGEHFMTMHRIKNYVKSFSSTAYGFELGRGSICVAVGYNSGLAIARKVRKELGGNPDDLVIATPKEGRLLWYEIVGIPKSATNVDGAYKFINFLLEKRREGKDFLPDYPTANLTDLDVAEILKGSVYLKYASNHDIDITNKQWLAIRS